MEEVYVEIKTLIVRKGLTQKVVAKEMGMTYQTLNSKINRQKGSDFYPVEILKLSHILNAPISQLVRTEAIPKERYVNE